jgi:hypothetical protein
MKDTFSFNELLNLTYNECSILFNCLFINTENNQILGYFCGKIPSDVKNQGCIKFVSQSGTYIHKIYGKSFIKNAKILKIIKL